MHDVSGKVILLIKFRGQTINEMAANLEDCGYSVITTHFDDRDAGMLPVNHTVDLVLADTGNVNDINNLKQLAIGDNTPMLIINDSTDDILTEDIVSSYPCIYLVHESSTTILDASIKMTLRLHRAQDVKRKLIDVTELSHIESELTRKEDLLNMSEAIAHVGTWEYNLADDRLTWSDEVYRIYGISPDEGQPEYSDFLELVHPDDRHMVDQAYRKSISNNQDHYEIEHRIIRKDTTEIRYVLEKCEHQRNREGAIIRSVGMVQDITDSKLIHEALYYSENKYRNLVDQAADMLFLHDLQGNIVDVNTSASTVTGYTREELLHMKVSDIDPDSVERDDPGTFWDTLGDDNVISFQGRHSRKDGSIYPVEITLNKIKLQDGTYILGLAKDITERKKAEADLRRALQEKDQLFSELQHRVKNSMQMMASLVNMELGNVETEDARIVLEKIQGQIRSLGNLYNILYSSGTIGTINLQTYLSSIISSLQTTYTMSLHNITIHQQYDPVDFDAKNAAPLGLIVNELVTNACKYAFPDDKQGNIWIELNAYPTGIVLAVKDDGAGLPDTFDTSVSGGSGLQLVEMLAKQLAGNFTFQSGDITTFTITIPMEEK
ncbi:MAG: PAS domain S-box protein [Spirochaetota bacterium]